MYKYISIRIEFLNLFRTLIFTGFINGQVKSVSALLDYQRALGILEQGRAKWANVDEETRGTVFSATFVRGVRRLYLDAYMQVRGDLAKWRLA